MDYRQRFDYKVQSGTISTEFFPVSCANLNWYSAGAPGKAGTNGTSRFMGDYVVPRYHARKRAGEKFFNALDSETLEVSDSASSMSTESIADACPGVKSKARDVGMLTAVFTPRAASNSKGDKFPLMQEVISQEDIDRLRVAVSTEVLSKRGTESTQTWESVAEYRQTLSMLSDPAGRVKDLAGRILSSAERSRTSRQLLKEVSDGYLMYRYGILPLMRDMQNIAESLAKGSGSNSEEKTTRAFGELKASRSFSGTTVTGAYTGHWQCHVDDFVTVRGMSLDRGNISFANALGLSSKGLLMLPLQLTSYSFVADWFTNLSSYVQASLPTLGWIPLGNALVTKRVTSTLYTLDNVTINSTSVRMVTVPSGTSQIIRRSTTRRGLSAPGFVINHSFGFENFTRTADALALAASRFVKVANLVGYRPNNSAFRDKKAYHAWSGQPDVQ